MLHQENLHFVIRSCWIIRQIQCSQFSASIGLKNSRITSNQNQSDNSYDTYRKESPNSTKKRSIGYTNCSYIFFWIMWKRKVIFLDNFHMNNYQYKKVICCLYASLLFILLDSNQSLIKSIVLNFTHFKYPNFH